MSIGPSGIIGSAAGSHLAQTRGADTDRAAQETSDQARQTEASRNATKAEGVGQTDEQEQTSDRDADGRRLWENMDGAEQENKEEKAETADEKLKPTAQSKDASGERGNQLDLTG